jgi:hypothetical protein
MRPTRHVPLIVLLAAVAGCADVAPTGAPSLASGSGSAGSGSASFVVYAGSPATFVLGEHRLAFDKNAICDPTVSTYGPGEWDRPCVVAQTGVRITATWSTDDRGHPVIDFQPALRFSPESNVTLWLMDKDASEDARYKIFWVDPRGALVDESIADSSVATHLGSNGYMFRRVKHFSGYTLSTGVLGREGEAEMYLRRTGGGRLAKPAPLKSGHLVATGRIAQEQ